MPKQRRNTTPDSLDLSAIKPVDDSPEVAAILTRIAALEARKPEIEKQMPADPRSRRILAEAAAVLSAAEKATLPVSPADEIKRIDNELAIEHRKLRETRQAVSEKIAQRVAPAYLALLDTMLTSAEALCDAFAEADKVIRKARAKGVYGTATLPEVGFPGGVGLGIPGAASSVSECDRARRGGPSSSIGLFMVALRRALRV